MLTPWKRDRILVGSVFAAAGTFPIEAAMMAANMAPGMNREFLSENWPHLIPKRCWYDAVNEANDCLDLSVETDIQGYDIDGEIIRAARANAQAAGVDHLIHFQRRPVERAEPSEKIWFYRHQSALWRTAGGKEESSGAVPDLRRAVAALDSWSAYVITAYEDMERYFGRKAAKNRKIYNGMMKTYFISSPAPSRRPRARQG